MHKLNIQIQVLKSYQVLGLFLYAQRLQILIDTDMWHAHKKACVEGLIKMLKWDLVFLFLFCKYSASEIPIECIIKALTS